MELLDRYLQAVGFWLPKAQKQDILQELADDIRSQMEEKESELHRALNRGDVEEILKQRGRPMLVAARYLPQQHLIGPVLFPVYAFVLKIVALGYLLPWLLVWTGFMIFDREYRARRLGLRLVGDWATFWQLALLLFAAVTIVFAVLERAQSSRRFLDNWEPRNLPAVARKPSRQARALFELAFTMAFIFSWLALPHVAPAVFAPLNGILKLTPAWNAYYLPILFIQLAVLGQQCLAMARPQWTWLRPAGQLFANAAGIIIVVFMMTTPPYVLIVDPANLERYGHATGIVNLIVLLSLAGVALGMLMACIVYAVQFFRQFRRFHSDPHNAPVLRMLW